MAKSKFFQIGWAAVLAFAMGIWCAASAETGAGATSLRYEEPVFLSGLIYARGADTNNILFRFQRTATRTGDTLNVRRDFTYPDGKLAAQERAIYEGNELVFYVLKELQIGAGGSAKIRHDRSKPGKGIIEFEYTGEAGSRAKTHTEDLPENALIGDMVGPFLVAHWDVLARGDKVKCRYLVVPRRETVGFTFVKDKNTSYQGQGAILVRMEPSSRLLSALVDPLFFTIETNSPHRVWSYSGRTTPKIRSGNKWKDLDATTVFDWETAR